MEKMNNQKKLKGNPTSDHTIMMDLWRGLFGKERISDVVL